MVRAGPMLLTLAASLVFQVGCSSCPRFPRLASRLRPDCPCVDGDVVTSEGPVLIGGEVPPPSSSVPPLVAPPPRLAPQAQPPQAQPQPYAPSARKKTPK